MSKYSAISKAIGWQNQVVTVPTIEEANNLFEKVRKEHCAESFTKVFTLYRFHDPCMTDDEFESMKIIWKAFELGKDIFKRYPA